MGCLQLGQMDTGVGSAFTSEPLREVTCGLRELACSHRAVAKRLLAGGHVST